jgi:hypothetical protein
MTANEKPGAFSYLGESGSYIRVIRGKYYLLRDALFAELGLGYGYTWDWDDVVSG